MPNPKCYYCSAEGIEQKRIIVDVDVSCDIDDEGKQVWVNNPLKSEEWLCVEHLDEEGDIDA